MDPVARERLMLWLWENGAGGAILCRPVIVRGNVAEFTELVLGSDGKPLNGRLGSRALKRRRRIRVRTPLRLGS
jgi:hypothetical protein